MRLLRHHPRGFRARPLAATALLAASAALAAHMQGCTASAERATAPRSPPSSGAFYASTTARTPSAAELTALGRALFFDASLSASGQLACATCHDPAHAFGPPDARSVQRGGAGARTAGVRAVPSLRYAQNVPPFTEHFFDGDGDESADQGPTGGRTWDGRAPSAHDQARLPLLSPLEMANPSAAALVDQLQRSPGAARFREVFGADAFDDAERAFRGVLLALEVFQQSPADFYPYSSKYDEWLRGRATLSPAEQRGRALFEDPAKGNCASCHPSAVRGGALPQFTDYGYAALGVPRNAQIPANADRAYHDLGLCGPLRGDWTRRVEYCGFFRTPSLRNVATRGAFFHNGVFHTLREAVRFYAQRDTRPERWYPRGPDGRTNRFDDLPPAARANVHMQAPFGRGPGDTPPLSDAEIEDLIAFLDTLSDADAAPPAAAR